MYCLPPNSIDILRVRYLAKFDDVVFQILVALEANTTRLT
jgi:hypothetical protein